MATRLWALALVCVAVGGGAAALSADSQQTLQATPQLDSAEPDAEEGIRVLEADVPRLGERIAIGEQVVRYRPVGLQANTQYEVRISYPASNPVHILLSVSPLGISRGGTQQPANAALRRRLAGVPAPAAPALDLGRNHHRKLLDAEKMVFSTDEFGKIRVAAHKSAEVDVLFRAERLAVHRGGGAAAPRTLVYDVVLEESFFGMPASAKPIAAWAVLLVVASAASVPLWSGRVVPALLRWLAQADGVGSRLRKLRTR